jgi:hypothetical protein
MVLSLHRLQDRGQDDVIGGWRRDVRHTLRQAGRLAAFQLLFALNAPRSIFPDFLTPWEGRHGLAAGLEALRATPAARLRHDLSLLAEERPLPSSAAALARGEPDALRHLADSMAEYAPGPRAARRRRRRAAGQPAAEHAVGGRRAGDPGLSVHTRAAPGRPGAAVAAVVLL